MGTSWKQELVIDSRDVDGFGNCKASALLGHLQEAATQAAEHGGFGRDILLEKYRGFWMISRVWARLERPLHWNEKITIHTWHRGGRGAVSYRDYDIYCGGQLVGEGVSAWVLTNWDTHQLMRLRTVEEMSRTDGGDLCKVKTLAKIKLPEDLEKEQLRPMRYSDTDINGHVNNTRYADFACDAIDMHTREKGRFLSELQIDYLAECYPGDVLSLRAGQQDGDYFVCGKNQQGKPCFEARMVFSSVE